MDDRNKGRIRGESKKQEGEWKWSVGHRFDGVGLTGAEAGKGDGLRVNGN